MRETMDRDDVEEMVNSAIENALEGLEIELKFIEEDVGGKTGDVLQVRLIRNDPQYIGGQNVLYCQHVRLPASVAQR